MASFVRRSVVVLWFGAALSGCGGEDDPALADVNDALFTIQFDAAVNGEPFSCGTEFGGIGTMKTSIKPIDFRFWVHDVALVRAGGEEVPLRLKQDFATNTLKDDGYWQEDNVALLDFEDATGTCAGTEETRKVVSGYAPEHDDYTSLRFVVGVPKALNHINAPAADYPMGAPGMAWQWKSGYRFVRLDVATQTHEKYYFHLGSTGCDGNPAEPGSISCEVENTAPISLDGFDPRSSIVVADIAKIYENLAVDAPDETTTACMSGGTTNPLCPAMFAALGLSYGEAQRASGQTFFGVR